LRRPQEGSDVSAGSHTGPLFQSIPTHMSLWDKYVLGWADPETFGIGSSARNVKLDQTSQTPKGTEDGIRVNLPDKVIDRVTSHSGEAMWYSNNDQSWADVKLSRTLEVPDGSDARIWMWNNYDIEELWDYGFVEVSTDGESTWTQLEVRDEAGNVVSTNEDPNGRLRDDGGLQNGLTGSTGNPLTDLYGTDLGDGIILGSGNPADGNPSTTRSRTSRSASSSPSGGSPATTAGW
jgi:immune inhibitor A